MYRQPRYNAGIYKFKRTTSTNNMVGKNMSASAGTLTQTNGYLVCTTPAAGGVPHYFTFGFVHTLEDIPDYTDFTTLYDSFRIVGIKAKILPLNVGSEYPTAAGTVTNGGFIHVAPDFDDNTAPATGEGGINELRQKTGYKCRSLQNFKGLSHYYRPKASIGVEGSTGVIRYGQAAGKMWMDCANITQKHFGHKGVIEIVQQGTAILNYYFKTEYTYYLQFKDVR